MRIFTCFTLFLLLFGCATKQKQEDLFPEYSFQELEAMAKEAKDRAQKSRDEMGEVHGAILDNKSSLDLLHAQLNDVSPNRIEELEVHLALLTEAYKDLYEQITAIKVLPQVRYAPRKPKKPTSFSMSKATVDLLGGDEYALYSRAQEEYRGGFYEKSIGTWNHLLTTFPTTRYQSNAHYWIGSALMMQRRYDDALLSFHRAENATNSRHQGRSILMSAKCYIKLSEEDKAIEKLTYLLARFPQSSSAQEARALLRSLEPTSAD